MSAFDSTYPGPDMLVDVVDTADQVVDTAARRDVLPRRDNFRVVHVFVFTGPDELLLQQLSETRTRHPLRWGASVAAYLFTGESYEDAARRRLAQELGIRDVQLHLLGKTSMLDNGSIKFIELYATAYAGPIDIDEAVIAQARPFAIGAITAALKAEPERFTPTFQMLFPFYLAARSVA